MKRTRILLTIPNFETAGSGKVVYDLAKYVNKHQFDVEIACCHNRGDFFKEVEKLGVVIHIFDTTTPYRPYITLPFRLRKIIRFFKANKYDIIHSWQWRSDWTEALAARLSGTKWIFTKKTMSWDNARDWELRSKLASFITILNPDMKERFFKRTKNVKLLPLGLDTSYYAIQEKKNNNDEISFPLNDFVVISVVNLRAIKGLEVLIDAIKILNDSSIKLLVVGDYDSEYGRLMMEKAVQDGLSQNVIFTGRVLDVRKYLALSDVFVIPTNVDWEGMPMAPVEAMSSGRIVIGTDTPGINFILKDFKEWLVPPNDAATIANKILQVKNMPLSARNEWAFKMRDCICNNYSIYHFINDYESLYKELCN